MMEPKEQNLNGIDIAEGSENHLEKQGEKEVIENQNYKQNQDEFIDVEKIKKENENLNIEIKKLQDQVEQLKDNWARERAEFSNYRKRMQQEIFQAKNLGIEELVKRLLPVIDNLDIVLASKSDNPEVQNFIYGVDMIRSEFLKILQNYQIVPIVDKGDKFNPNLMEAIDVEIIDDLKEEVVTEVYKKAYVKYYDLQNKDKYVVLRTATVKVGKPRQVNLNNESNNTSNQNSNNENHQNEKNEIKN